MSNITPKLDHPRFNKLKQFRSIRYTIPVIIIAPLVAAVSAIGWLTFQGGQQQIDQLIYQVSDKSTVAIESNVEGYLASHNAFLSMQLAVIESGNLNPNNFSQLQSYFWQQLRQQEIQGNSIWKIYLGNERGNFLGVQRDDKQYLAQVRDNLTQGKRETYLLDSQGNRFQKKPILQKYDSRSRPWYKTAEEAGNFAWSDIYVYATPNSDGSHSLGITLAVPLIEHKTGNFQGVLATDLTLSNISKFLQELSISPTGRAFIIDRNGNLVATSSQEELLQKKGTELYPIKATNSSDPLVKATSASLLEKFLDFNQIKKPENLVFTIKGQQQFVKVKPLQGKQQPDWLMVVIIPKADFMQHIYSYTKFTLIVGLLVTGIAVILALITVRWITQPIQRLHQAAQGIQSQKFDSINLEMVSKRPDEFGKLGKVFLGMVQVTYSREQNWQQLVQQLKSESSGSPILQNLTSKKGQIIHLEQLLKKARIHRENISRSSPIDANDVEN